jgi:trigger factor
MEVTVETTAGLERRLKVAVPEDRIRSEVDKRLNEMASRVRVPGFRPGKAPRRVVAQRFGRQVREEVVGELLSSSFYDALQQEQLRPAGRPTIDPVATEPGGGLNYTAIFDVFPEVELPAVEGLEIVRPVAEVGESDVDAMIERLRHQRREWNEVDRPATASDRAIIDFEGFRNDEPIEQARATEFPLELSGGRMLEGFEAGLVGASAGEERRLELRFPEQHPEASLAGQPVRFEVRIRRVEEPRRPEVDEAFVRSFGIEDGSTESLRREIRANMERELADALRTATKARVMQTLLTGRDIELPRSLIEQENQRALEQRRNELIQAGIDPEGMTLDPSAFEEQSRRRVALGLLLSEVIRSNELRVDPARVRARVETIASTYEDPHEVLSWYYGDRSRLSDIESAVLEDQVVEWILERAQVREEPTTFDALLNPGQTPR